MAMTQNQKRGVGVAIAATLAYAIAAPFLPGPGGGVSIMSDTPTPTATISGYPGPLWGSGTATWTPTTAATATGTPEPEAGRWLPPPGQVWAEEIDSFEDEWPESADALNNAKADIEQRNFRHTSVSGDVKFQNGCVAGDVQIGGADPQVGEDQLIEMLGPADLSLQGVFERGPRLYTLVFWRGVGDGEVDWPALEPTPNPTSSDLGGSHPDDFLADTLAITVGTFPVGDAIVTTVSDCGGFHESIFWLQESLAGDLFYLTRW